MRGQSDSSLRIGGSISLGLQRFLGRNWIGIVDFFNQSAAAQVDDVRLNALFQARIALAFYMGARGARL
jgi:hypothetical protein